MKKARKFKFLNMKEQLLKQRPLMDQNSNFDSFIDGDRPSMRLINKPFYGDMKWQIQKYICYVIY